MEAVLSKAYVKQLPTSDTCDIYDGQDLQVTPVTFMMDRALVMPATCTWMAWYTLLSCFLCSFIHSTKLAYAE